MPSKKPVAKCEKLPWVQSRNIRPRDKAKAPAAVNKFLRRVTLPPVFRYAATPEHAQPVFRGAAFAGKSTRATLCVGPGL